jgi:hypothetical protein
MRLAPGRLPRDSNIWIRACARHRINLLINYRF